MMKTRSLVLTAVICIICLSASSAKANVIYLYYGPYAYSVGGEFTAVTDPNAFNGNYAASTLVGVNPPNPTGLSVGFETFCVQTMVDFTPYNWGNSTPYSWNMSLGSVGNPNTYALSQGTAYLYWQFATGQLHGYHFSTATPADVAARIQDAGQLQAAIWALQGNQSYPGFPNGVTGNVFYQDALTALGPTRINQAADLNDNFGVQILNLTALGNPNAPAQNQLVYTGGGEDTHYQNAPDGSSTAVLLGLTLIALASFRMKRAISAKSAPSVL